MAKVIGTHNGKFHCDEALAVFMLRQTREFKDAGLIRTRDENILDGCDVVVDVGGVYDPEKMRFDHHQKGFFETFSPEFQTKLSSAGLVYKHFGKQIIASQLNLEETDPTVGTLYRSIYEDFIEALDGSDNGISRYPPDVPAKYKDTTRLPDRVNRLNPWWNMPDDVDKRFEQAVALTGSELTDRIRYKGLSWLPAREIVLKSFETRYDVDKSGQIIELETFCPWTEHLFNIEKEFNVPNDQVPLYVIFKDVGGTWRVQAVPIASDSYQSRKPLPESWCGYRDGELSERAKIEDCVFVHGTGFIGGNKTRDGAITMARKSVEA